MIGTLIRMVLLPNFIRRIFRNILPTKGRSGSCVLFVLILGCSLGPERDSTGAGAVLLRVNGGGDLEGIRSSEAVQKVMKGDEEGEHLLVVERGHGDSLSNSIEGLGSQTELERVEVSEVKIPAKELRSPELPASDPASGFDFPDIFDIFTRVY